MNNIILDRNEIKQLLIENPACDDIQITLPEGAGLTLTIIEDTANETFDFNINANLAADTSLHLNLATFSAPRVNTAINVNLNGTGASAHINGIVLAADEQQISYTTNIGHHAEHTTSAQLFKYVADGNSRCSFNGRIIVDEQARFTEAHQTNRNLLASAGAQMHAEPTLEIYCDEVQCSHGAATGQLDENALFYMRQRGIGLETARRMLMRAFVAEVAERIADESLRTDLLNRIDQRFTDI